MNKKFNPGGVNSAQANIKRTICEVHREIYDILEDHFSDSEYFDGISEKLEEAYNMAKKMNAKLQQYKFKYDDTWWETTTKEIQQQKLKHRKAR